MDQFTLEQLIKDKKEIDIVYRPEKDEVLKNYTLEPIEIKSERLQHGSVETYLYAIKLPKNSFNPKVQRFIIGRIISVS